LRCAYGPITLCGRPFQVLPLALPDPTSPALQPQLASQLVWPLPLSLAATGGISSISVPLATKMFQFTRFASLAGYGGFTAVGCPIRTSRDHSFGAAPPGFSQLSTSFIASDSLTIHRAPLGAYNSSCLSVPRFWRCQSSRLVTRGRWRAEICAQAMTSGGQQGIPGTFPAKRCAGLDWWR
jgi:hypothetical protein